MDPTNPADLQELQQAVFNQRLYNAIFAVVAIASNALGVYALFRRQPPLDRELAQFQLKSACAATHASEKADHRIEHEAEEARSVREHTSLDARLDKGNELFRQIERSLGRIESSIEDVKKKIGLA